MATQYRLNIHQSVAYYLRMSTTTTTIQKNFEGHAGSITSGYQGDALSQRVLVFIRLWERRPYSSSSCSRSITITTLVAWLVLVHVYLLQVNRCLRQRLQVCNNPFSSAVKAQDRELSQVVVLEIGSYFPGYILLLDCWSVIVHFTFMVP